MTCLLLSFGVDFGSHFFYHFNFHYINLYSIITTCIYLHACKLLPPDDIMYYFDSICVYIVLSFLHRLQLFHTCSQMFMSYYNNFDLGVHVLR